MAASSGIPFMIRQGLCLRTGGTAGNASKQVLALMQNKKVTGYKSRYYSASYTASNTKVNLEAPKMHNSDIEFIDTAEAANANWKARCDLAACYRILWKLGFSEGICNHLSYSCPAKDGSDKVMLLIDYGLHWSEVTASSLVGLSLKDPRNPKPVEGKGEAELSATCIHNGIHQVRPDIHCVLHAHPPYTTALTCLKDPTLQMLHQNSTRFYNDICYDTEYDGVASAVEEGFRLGKIIGNHNVMFMGNHGVLVLGKTAAEAFDHLYYLERAAMTQV